MMVNKYVVQSMLKKSREIIQRVHGDAIDPYAIRKADPEVRDCQFVKLELFINFLYSTGQNNLENLP